MANTHRTGSSWTEQESKDSGIMGRKDNERKPGDRGRQGGFQEEGHESEQEKGMMGRVGEMAGSAAERAGQAATAVADQARNAASAVADQARNAASSVADQARNAASTVGSGIKSLGETIRQHTPHTGMLGTAAEGVAGTLETSGTFLQEKGFAGVADEMTTCVKNHPMTSVAISIGCGFLLGCLFSSRR